VRRVTDLSGPLEGAAVVTVGVFDGVHLGHQGVLRDLKALAAELGAPATVLTFDTHPDGLVSPGEAPPLLVSLEYRLLLLEREGVDQAVVLPFDRSLRELTAREFAFRILRDRLHCKALVMGFDSALGRGREGDLEVMTRLGKEAGFLVRRSLPILWRGRPISSSILRETILKGDLGLAWALLGRPPSFLGKVVQGNHRGKSLGFPTANLEPQGLALPPPGVYAARAVLEGKSWPAVLDLGTCPTFQGHKTLLEVHLIGYEGEDFYGKPLEVFFHARLRGERAFPSPRELAAQIEKDLRECLAILGEEGKPEVDTSRPPSKMPGSESEPGTFSS